MSTGKDSLLAAIDALVEQKTFSLDALEGVKSLRDKVAAVEQEIERARQTVANQRQEISAKDVEISVWLTREVGIGKRENAVMIREAEAGKLEIGKAVAEAKATAIHETIKLIFRNIEFRSSMSGTVPMAPGAMGQYPSGQPISKNQDFSAE